MQQMGIKPDRYTVSISCSEARKAFEGCWKAKSLAFRDYEVVDEDPPHKDKYDQFLPEVLAAYFASRPGGIRGRQRV